MSRGDEEDLVRLYLTDIGQYPLLTKEGEVRLAQEIEAGIEARRELAESKPTPARRRELRRLSRKGEAANRTFVQCKLASGCFDCQEVSGLRVAAA